MKRIVFFGLLGLSILPILGFAWAASDLGALTSPDVTLSTPSGPPGTMITITLSNIPDISNETYPYHDLYIYLPFSQPFGVTPQSHCGGEDCFPIYTHDQAVNHDLANKTVTFSLFSTGNPNPVYLNGFENSVCDVLVNGKTVYRYSTLCNAKDQPAGTYYIKFGWAEENAPQINNIIKTVQFMVTSSSPPSPPEVADNGNSIIQAYQNGQISESDFYSKLSSLGWSTEQIRQALATIGKLPHQVGAPAPEQLQQIQQGIKKAAEQVDSQLNQQTTQAIPKEQTTQQITQPSPTEQPVLSLTPYKSTQSSQNIKVQTDKNPVPQTSSWTMITIASSLSAVAVIACGFYAIKHIRKVTR